MQQKLLLAHVLVIYSFVYGNIMNARTKKRIVLEALNGGEESTDALVLAMLVPFIHDHEMAIAEVKKYIPTKHLGLFTSKLCDELTSAGSNATAKLCYGAFKKHINKHLAKRKEHEAKTSKAKTPKPAK